jgi:hypothetical protein
MMINITQVTTIVNRCTLNVLTSVVWITMRWVWIGHIRRRVICKGYKYKASRWNY